MFFLTLYLALGEGHSYSITAQVKPHVIFPDNKSCFLWSSGVEVHGKYGERWLCGFHVKIKQ